MLTDDSACLVLKSSGTVATVAGKMEVIRHAISALNSLSIQFISLRRTNWSLICIFLMVSDGYDPLDPDGNITVTIDVRKWIDGGYLVRVTSSYLNDCICRNRRLV